MLVPVSTEALSGAAAGGTGWQPGAGRRRGQVRAFSSTRCRGPALRPATSSPAPAAAVQCSQAHRLGRTIGPRRRGECPALGELAGSGTRLLGATAGLGRHSAPGWGFQILHGTPSRKKKKTLKTPRVLAGPLPGGSGDPRNTPSPSSVRLGSFKLF